MRSFEHDHHKSSSDRLAAELSTFGGHVVDGLEAIRDLVLSAVEDLGTRLREDIRTQGRRLDRIESQLVTSAELSVTEAERLADLATAMREIATPGSDTRDVVATDREAGAVTDLHARAEALTIAVRDDVLGVFAEVQGDLRSLRLELEGLREEVEALRQELDGQGLPAAAADSDAELGRLATEVRLLRRRLQLQERGAQ